MERKMVFKEASEILGMLTRWRCRSSRSVTWCQDVIRTCQYSSQDVTRTFVDGMRIRRRHLRGRETPGYEPFDPRRHPVPGRDQDVSVQGYLVYKKPPPPTRTAIRP
jgi:hypothetical protein